MTRLANQTAICDLLRERPWLRRILVAYGLEPDSNQSLERACRAAQVRAEELGLHLSQVWDGPDGLRKLRPPQLLDYIVHCHHRYLRRVLPHLFDQARAAARQNPRYQPVSYELAEFARQANPHMFREEMEVFPAIRDLHSSDQRAVHLPRWVQRLEQEHGKALQHFLALRQALRESGEDPESRVLIAGLTELDEDMRWHMYAENDLLFPSFRLSA